jgi:capsular polysaccharide biosynthesis protein
LDPGRKARLNNLDPEKMGTMNRQQYPWMTEDELVRTQGLMDEIVNELEDNENAALLNSSISPADPNELGIVAMLTPCRYVHQPREGSFR